jgi:hypothetical protein
MYLCVRVKIYFLARNLDAHSHSLGAHIHMSQAPLGLTLPSASTVKSRHATPASTSQTSASATQRLTAPFARTAR